MLLEHANLSLRFELRENGYIWRLKGLGLLWHQHQPFDRWRGSCSESSAEAAAWAASALAAAILVPAFNEPLVTELNFGGLKSFLGTAFFFGLFLHLFFSSVFSSLHVAGIYPINKSRRHQY